MIKAAFIGIMILLIPSLALTEPILTIACHEPQGKRTEYGVFPSENTEAMVKKKAPPKPRLRTADAGYKGVTPTFIIDSAMPNKMIYVWGDSAEIEPYKDAARQFGLKVPAPAAAQANIIVFNEELISTIEQGPRYAALWSFFPKLGVAYFVEHNVRFFGSAAWNVQDSLFAHCEFAWKPHTPIPPVK